MSSIGMIEVEKYFEAFFIFFLIGLSLFIMKNFVLPILLAAALVFLTYKIHLKLLKLIKNETISALIVLFGVIFVFLFPTYWVINRLIREVTYMVRSGVGLIDNIDLSSCSVEVCRFIEGQISFLDFSLDVLLLRFSSYIYNSIGSIFSSVTDFFVGLFIFVFAFFFLLKDGDKFVRYVKRIIPMRSEYKTALFLRFRDVTRAVFINTILVSLLQGTLVGIGLWLLGFNSPVFWILVTSLAAMIPIFGPSLVWGPIALYLALSGDYFSAIVLACYGAFLVSVADNIARPFLLKKKINVHEFLILLGILGGIEVFGFILGLFLGPIIISLLVSVLQLYNLDFR